MKKLLLIFSLFLFVSTTFTDVTFAQYTSDYTGAEIDAGIAKLADQTKEAIDSAIANTRPYKVYTALLSQSGTDAPVATVLENSIGGIVWSRINTGSYRATLAGVFSNTKTFVLVEQWKPLSDAVLTANVSATGNYVGFNTHTILVAGSALDPVPTDSLIIKRSIEIRVYP